MVTGTTPTLSTPELKSRSRVGTVIEFLAPTDGAKRRFIAPAICAVAGLFALITRAYELPTISIVLAAISLIAGGGRATVESIGSLRTLRPDINVLMILAAIVSLLVGHWDEGIVLLFLFSLSNALEHYATHRTRESVHSLMRLRPDQASRVRNGEETSVPVEQLEIGDIVRIRPGDRLPVDGTITEGRSSVNESMITGESLPVSKSPGDLVFAGTINNDGSLLVRMTRPPQESTLQRIVQLVERAQENRGTLHRVLDRWQTPYVNGVLLISLLTFVIGWALTGELMSAVYRAMLLLVAASPCAVMLATPTAVLATVTRAARLGILFKGGISIERLAAVDTIALDKTGTLTQGLPVLTSIEPLDGVSPDHALAAAASVERLSEHPLARAVVRAADERKLSLFDIDEFSSDPGIGVGARVQGEWVGVGAVELFARKQMAIPAELSARLQRSNGETGILLMGTNGIGAVLAFRDEPRTGAIAALKRLRSLGASRIVMLTGDRAEAAAFVGEKLGITEFKAGMSPEQKLDEIGRLSANGRGVAMVGDGVNDAPALAAATVGVAMGAAGSDVAIETADVVLMRDDLNSLADALSLARRGRAVIRQSLTIAFGMIAILIMLTMLNWLPLPLAVLCHEGSTVLVVLNGLRLARSR